MRVAREAWAFRRDRPFVQDDGMSAEASRVLLIGASGQVGHALTARFQHDNLVRASHSHGRPGDILVDLGDRGSIQAALLDAQPDLVLVSGAMCNAEQCEVDPDACERVNTTGPATIAEYARDNDARVVFFSTDHVFDGAMDSYAEGDAVNPLNAYARSKARAEALIRELVPTRHLILRTGWVYGPDAERRNFALRLVDRIAAGETVEVPSDQWGSPTYSEDLAHATRYLVDHDAVGTFHATGPELLDRKTLALRICDAFGLDRSGVVARPTRELGQVARRSLRVRLDCEKLGRSGAPPFRGVTDGLRALASAPSTPTRR
jgi:dTDP-4-dehydrorhamnose reductase